jgi:hypothetical protein
MYGNSLCHVLGATGLGLFWWLSHASELIPAPRLRRCLLFWSVLRKWGPSPLPTVLTLGLRCSLTELEQDFY